MKQAKRFIHVVLRRVIFLDGDLANTLVIGNEQDSKMVSLYLAMKNNRLFIEFDQEVYMIKANSNEKVITKDDIMDFFSKKKQKSRVVARWKSCVSRKLGQVYINTLIKAGLIDNILNRKSYAHKLITG